MAEWHFGDPVLVGRGLSSFLPVLDAITSNSVSTAPLEQFAVFSPALADYQLRYRSVCEWLVI